MTVSGDGIWDHKLNDALVERLIGALQGAVLATLEGRDAPDQHVPLPAPELATALLNLLASILQPAPQCRTATGMRRASEETGKQLLTLMRGYRDLSRGGGPD